MAKAGERQRSGVARAREVLRAAAAVLQAKAARAREAAAAEVLQAWATRARRSPEAWGRLAAAALGRAQEKLVLREAAGLLRQLARRSASAERGASARLRTGVARALSWGLPRGDAPGRAAAAALRVWATRAHQVPQPWGRLACGALRQWSEASQAAGLQRERAWLWQLAGEEVAKAGERQKSGAAAAREVLRAAAAVLQAKAARAREAAAAEAVLWAWAARARRSPEAWGRLAAAAWSGHSTNQWTVLF